MSRETLKAPSATRAELRADRVDGEEEVRPAQRAALSRLMVQRFGRGLAATGPEVQATAESGLTGASRTLPHADAIQSSFGRHDVSEVQAHVGGPAETASQEMGAEAFATGDSVAFAKSPDLHTAAHEAAHVVQQRAGVSLKGGVGQAGDAYEQHADRVADAVTAGRSAEGLLDQMAPAGGGASAVHGTDVQKRDAATAEGRSDVEPKWSRHEIRRIQRQLRRIHLYHLGIDGIAGGGTNAALVEAFGNDSWRTMSADDVVDKLAGVATPKEKGDAYHYGQMFRDGVLDITLGVGFDEGDNHLNAIAGFQRVLAEHAFVLNASKAQQLYAQAGRSVQASDFGQFYVRENALTYTPPVGGAGRQIHAIVRLLFSKDGSEGGKASGAFREGMAQSDIAYYSGHGRYGTGPDFDRNMSFELLDADGSVERTIMDYEVLERELKKEGRHHGRSAWRQFLWRERHDRINVIGTNEGNVFLNKHNAHPGEFGANLMYWNLKRTGGAGAELQTGKGGGMETQRESPSARDYRVLVFDGCRTQDYSKSIRRTPGVSQHNTDILATRRTVDWGDEVETLAAFLDGILARQNKREIIHAMDEQQSETKHGTYRDA